MELGTNVLDWCLELTAGCLLPAARWTPASRTPLARMFHELVLRDQEDGRATGQPQGVGPEAYLNGTSQGELVLSLSKEHPRTHGRTAISVVVVSDS